MAITVVTRNRRGINRLEVITRGVCGWLTQIQHASTVYLWCTDEIWKLNKQGRSLEDKQRPNVILISHRREAIRKFMIGAARNILHILSLQAQNCFSLWGGCCIFPFPLPLLNPQKHVMKLLEGRVFFFQMKAHFGADLHVFSAVESTMGVFSPSSWLARPDRSQGVLLKTEVFEVDDPKLGSSGFLANLAWNF